MLNYVFKSTVISKINSLWHHRFTPYADMCLKHGNSGQTGIFFIPAGSGFMAITGIVNGHEMILTPEVKRRRIIYRSVKRDANSPYFFPVSS
jgi:hypothetical protein